MVMPGSRTYPTTIPCRSRSLARVHVAHQKVELGMQPAEDLVRADGLERETMGLAQQVQQRDRFTAGQVHRRGLPSSRSDVHVLIVQQVPVTGSGPKAVRDGR